MRASGIALKGAPAQRGAGANPKLGKEEPPCGRGPERDQRQWCKQERYVRWVDKAEHKGAARRLPRHLSHRLADPFIDHWRIGIEPLEEPRARAIPARKEVIRRPHGAGK